MTSSASLPTAAGAAPAGMPATVVRSNHVGTAAPGRLVAGQPAQVAQDDRHPVAGREPADLLVEDRPEVLPQGRGGGVIVRHLKRPPLPVPPPGPVRPGVGGDPAGDPVEPRPERVTPAQRAGLPGQDEEGGLERVLGVVGVRQRTPADPEHHRPVAGDQRGERGGVAPPANRSSSSASAGAPAASAVSRRCRSSAWMVWLTVPPFRVVPRPNYNAARRARAFRGRHFFLPGCGGRRRGR